MPSTVFNKYAKYYDILYKEKDYEREVAFILETLKRGGFKGKKILSLGCGTCTYEMILARKGFLITGVDVSAPMLSVAKEKIVKAGLQSKIKLVHRDVRKLKLKGKYDIVMCMFNVMGYQNTNQDLSDTLKGVSKILKKGGAFFFDCWHMPAVIADKPQKRVRNISVNGNRVVRKTTPKLFFDKNLLQINFDVKNYKSKKLIDSANETHTMRYFSLPELDYFLKIQSMKTENVYNFLELNSKISDNKWDLFVIAKKI